MVASFSQQLKDECRPIWNRIYAHPFLQEIKDGSLPLHKFRYYLLQDYLYLEAFARAVALALAKSPDSDTLEGLAKRLLTPVERPLHRRLMPLAGIEPHHLHRLAPSPTNTAYTNHLLKVASLGSLGATAAALLPCPWTYHELAEVIGYVDHPVYGPWSAVYVEGFLAESVEAWRALLDRFAFGAPSEELASMRDAFVTSSRYEFLFWEMAYNTETWPV